MSECQTKAGNQNTLSLTHSLTLDMLNNFCFHVYAQKSLSHFHTLSLSHSHSRGERVPGNGNGNGNAGNRPIRFRRISDYDPFLDMDSLIAQIPCLVGSSQPLLLVNTVLHKGWISEQIVSVPGVRS